MDWKRLTAGGFKLKKFIFAAAALSALALAGLTQVADAQTMSGDTWSLSFYGTIDVNYVGQTHGSPLNPLVPPGFDTFSYQNNKSPSSGIAGGGLSLSNIGLRGEDKLTDDLSAVFDLRMYFNPWSGMFPSGAGSVQQNNGVPLFNQNGNGDSGISGAPLEIAYAGLKSQSAGTLTIGRQFTINADQTFNYDPMSRSAFLSYIGFFGGIAGAGRTEDGIMSAAAKYVVNFGKWHIGLFDQPVGAEGYGYAEQGNVGAEFGDFSFDITYSWVADSVVAAAPCQNLSASCGKEVPANFTPTGPVLAKVSDNESTQIGLKYKWAPTSAVYAGYEAMAFYNPAQIIHGPQITEAGIPIFIPQYGFFNKPLYQNVWWVGTKFAVTQKLDLAVAYYESDQNSYATGANAGCHDNRAVNCSGTYLTQSAMADYHFDTKVDAYIGFMNDTISGGYQSSAPFGNPANNNTLGMVGLRLRF